MNSGFNEFRERSLLQHVVDHAAEGDPASVLSAMDQYWDSANESEGSEVWRNRSEALDQLITGKQPKCTLELGTYCGYSAVRLGRLLPPGGVLVSIEKDPLLAAIATKIVEHAGLSDSVKILIGTAASRLGYMQSTLALVEIDAVLIDTLASQYLPDLKELEASGMMTSGTLVICDTTTYPGDEAAEGVKEYLAHLASRANVNTKTIPIGKRKTPTMREQIAMDEKIAKEEGGLVVSTYWDAPLP